MRQPLHRPTFVEQLVVQVLRRRESFWPWPRAATLTMQHGRNPERFRRLARRDGAVAGGTIAGRTGSGVHADLRHAGQIREHGVGSRDRDRATRLGSDPEPV